MSSGQPNKIIIEPSYMPLRGAAAHAVFRRPDGFRCPDVFRCPCWKFAHSAIVQLGGSSWAWSEFAHGLIRGQIRPIATARRPTAYSPSAQLQRQSPAAWLLEYSQLQRHNQARNVNSRGRLSPKCLGGYRRNPQEIMRC